MLLLILEKQKRKKKIAEANAANAANAANEENENEDDTVADQLKSLRKYEGSGADPFYPQKGRKTSLQNQETLSGTLEDSDTIDTGTVKPDYYENDTVKITPNPEKQGEVEQQNLSDTVKIYDEENQKVKRAEAKEQKK